MKKTFKILSFVIILSILLYGGYHILDNRVYYNQVAAYVNRNYEKPETLPYNELITMTIEDIHNNKHVDFAKKNLGITSMVKDVYPWNDGDVINFYCGGSGNVTSSVYTGFYRSEKDIPYAFEFEDKCF